MRENYELRHDGYLEAIALVDSQFISTDIGVVKFKNKALLEAFPKARFNRNSLVEIAYLGLDPEASVLPKLINPPPHGRI